MAKVIFNVGEYHPLFNKVVDAIILNRNGGYNGKLVYAKTKYDVYHPYNPKGKIVFDSQCNIVGYLPRAAFLEKWKGWVKEIIEDDEPTNIEVTIYDDSSKKILIECCEEHKYYEGETFQPFDNNVGYFVVFASKIQNGKQMVVAKKIQKQ